MQKLLLSTLSLFVLIAPSSCKKSGFSGDNKPSKPANQKENVLDQSQASPSQAPGQNANCLKELVPMQVTFILDVSTSMQPNIDLLKNNITNFAANLKSITPQGSNKPIQDLRLALTTYVEGAQYLRQTPPTSDVNQFRNTINAVTIGDDYGNQDGPEEGLTAAQRSLESIKSQNSTTEMIQVMLVITDNYAHSGGTNFNRIFDDSGIANALMDKAFNYFYLFDSSPTFNPPDPYSNGTQKAPPHASPSAQWQAIRNRYKTQKAKSDASGAQLGFPFSSSGLLQTLPQYLANALKICK